MTTPIADNISVQAELYFLNEVTGFGNESSRSRLWLQSESSSKYDVLRELILLASFCVRQVRNFGSPTRDPWGELINRILKQPPILDEVTSNQLGSQQIEWHSEVFSPLGLTRAQVPVCKSGSVKILSQPDSTVK
ncbi:hypothetical protein BH23CHL2_BH23CHL2_05770 [soil metagenome]